MLLFFGSCVDNAAACGSFWAWYLGYSVWRFHMTILYFVCGVLCGGVSDSHSGAAAYGCFGYFVLVLPCWLFLAWVVGLLLVIFGVVLVLWVLWVAVSGFGSDVAACGFFWSWCQCCLAWWFLLWVLGLLCVFV